jgi:hypothetical protein
MSKEDELQARLADAEAFGTLMEEIAERELRTERDNIGALLTTLHNDRRINLTSDQNLKAIEGLAHNDFWFAVHPLTQAIAGLNCSHQDVLLLVRTLVTKAGNDGVAGQPNLALQEWSKGHPRESVGIIEGIEKEDPNCLAHGLFAVLGLGDESIASKLLASRKVKVRMIGLNALSRMEILTEDKKMETIDAALEVLASETEPEPRANAIQAAFRLWEKLGSEKPYRQGEVINSVGALGDKQELSQLAAMLFLHHSGMSRDSVALVLRWLSNTPSNSDVTLSNLDHAIYRRDERWDFIQVVEVFAYCIPTLSTKPEGRTYHHFAEWLWEAPANTSYIYARWLENGNRALCEYLSALLQGRNSSPGIDIQRAHCPNAVVDQIFLARKAIGYLWHKEVSTASILLSVVKHGKSEARQDAEDLLFNPLLLSYGGQLREYLEGRRGDRSKRIAACVKRLLDRHDTHIAGLETPKNLVELRPSNDQRRAAALKDHERNRDIQRQARERSIFGDLFTTQNLLYGRKTFSIIHGTGGKTHPNISELSEFSYSMELPRLSVIDPVGFNEMLTIFRDMQRRS